MTYGINVVYAGVCVLNKYFTLLGLGDWCIVHNLQHLWPAVTRDLDRGLLLRKRGHGGVVVERVGEASDSWEDKDCTSVSERACKDGL